MRRITVFEWDGSWRFSSPSGEHEARHHSALDAANAGRDFGETLRGQVLGYVIRLQIPYVVGSDLGITIHTQVF